MVDNLTPTENETLTATATVADAEGTEGPAGLAQKALEEDGRRRRRVARREQNGDDRNSDRMATVGNEALEPDRSQRARFPRSEPKASGEVMRPTRFRTSR